MVIADVDNIADVGNIVLLENKAQIFRANRLSGGEDDGPLHHVFQFAHISGPHPTLEQGERIRLDILHRLLKHLSILVEKMPGNPRNVFRMLTQRRRFDLHDVNAVLMSGENQARPQRNEPVTAQAVEFHLLQHAQELDLRKRTQVPNLIEEKRAVARLLEVAFARPSRTGEGALFMPEQLGFNQSFRDSAAGDSYEGTTGSGAQIVNGAGD